MALRTATPIVAVTAVATGLLLGGTAYAALSTTPSASSSTGSSTSQTALELGDDHGGLRSQSAGAEEPGESGAAHDLAEAAAKAATGSDDALEANSENGTDDDGGKPATAPTHAASMTHGDEVRSQNGSAAPEHAQDTEKRHSAAASAQAMHKDHADDNADDASENSTEDSAKGSDDAAEHSSATEAGDDHNGASGSDDEQAEQESEHSGGHHGSDD
ncbi:MAG: hypothetical protein ACTHOD_15470 [Motilibacteraceae bacterium]